ncbi:MAG: hypothetical protein Q9227_009122 [Pyrenula ochraceoflavens]
MESLGSDCREKYDHEHRDLDAINDVCSKCHRILDALRIQDDDGNKVQRGADLDITIQSLQKSKESHCYICNAIVEEVQPDLDKWKVSQGRISQEIVSKALMVDTEYLLHKAPAEGLEEPTIELRVNVVFHSPALDEPKKVFYKLFVLYPDQDNLEMFKKGIKISDLPQNFQDAIKVTRTLGFHYIWIDSLCILQDEINNDWRREASLMHKVYACSTLTIAATSASNSHCGLFSKRSPASTNPPVIRLCKEGFQTQRWRVIDNAMWTKEVDDAPLTQRGWVLQERLLSRRVIHFGRNQILWECRSSEATEVLQGGLLPGRNPMKSRVKELDSGSFARAYFDQQDRPEKRLWLAALWAHVIERYSGARLTRPRDKLIALSGIAAKLAENHSLDSEMYVAGLWREGMEHLLIWQTAGQPSGGWNHRAPSWSWASVDDAVCQPNAWKSDALIATVKEVQVLKEKDNPFGKVYGGFLKIDGQLLEVGLARVEGKPPVSPTWITDVEGHSLVIRSLANAEKIDMEPEVQLDRSEPSLADVDKYYCLPVYHDCSQHELRGLILAENPDQGDFERVGSFWMWDKLKIMRLLYHGASKTLGNLDVKDFPRTTRSILII